jgi:Uri superfamily endonuclease
MTKKRTFCIQNKIHWHIDRLLRGRTVSYLVHQLRRLGSRQQPQSGALFTSFLTWGTENILAKTNLESMGCDKGL